MAVPSASGRLRRLLAIVPWVAAHDGPTIDEICSRFSVTRAEVLADLDVVFMVGLHPYTPDQLIDVVIEDDRVWIRYADFFARALRLTPAEGLALVAAGTGLLAERGAEQDGPLARGLAKLAASLGVEDPDAVEVDLGAASSPILELLRRAVQEHRSVSLEYYSYGRDERTERRVDPWRVYSDAGQWYLLAWCHRAGGERVFRTDRIADAALTEGRFAPPTEPPGEIGFRAGPDDARVVLDLAPGARWVPEQYPTESTEEQPDGWLRVTLAVTTRPWLERLLLRLGADARLMSSAPSLGGDHVAAEAATRLLGRYRPG
ncbi:hypothetical protein BH20ACT2_BH20ACT2_06470 [soil metagenome]